MRSRHLFAAWLLVLATSSQPVLAADNQLTPAEKEAGWKLLFDGATTKPWISYKTQAPALKNWVVEDGWLHCLGKGSEDIITPETYTEFELTWEWKLVAGANSGVKYFVSRPRGQIGHEYQIIDDAGHPDGQKAEGKRATAAFYDVLKPSAKTQLKPLGEANSSRVLVQGKHVEHWLNGAKVLEYELGSQVIKTAVSESKFKDAREFGSAIAGHILLQDHNGDVWFRNIKLRNLKP